MSANLQLTNGKREYGHVLSKSMTNHFVKTFRSYFCFINCILNDFEYENFKNSVLILHFNSNVANGTIVTLFEVSTTYGWILLLSKVGRQ